MLHQWKTDQTQGLPCKNLLTSEIAPALEAEDQHQQSENYQSDSITWNEAQEIAPRFFLYPNLSHANTA